MTRTISLLSHPAGPIIAVVVAAGLVLLRPDGPITWVIGVSSLAWLNAAFALRRSTSTRVGGSLAAPPSEGTRKYSGVVVVAAMATGMLVGGLATLAVGPIGAAVGGVVAVIAAIAIEFVRTGSATPPNRDRGAILRQAAISGGGVGIALAYWWFLRR